MAPSAFLPDADEPLADLRRVVSALAAQVGTLVAVAAGRTDYVFNGAALTKMRTVNMAAAQIAAPADHAQTSFADEAAWHRHLHRLGFDTLKTTPDPVKVATEGAL